YYGMATIAAETVAHTHLLNELAPLQWHINSETDYAPTNDTITIHTDNSSALQVAINPVFHKRMKHVHNRYHFLRNLVRWCIIRFQHVYSADNSVDMMVKALP
ncbi:MAG: Ty1/Copia family ribonuclease HI, partial [bacterium]